MPGSAEDASRRGQNAAQSLFTAASAANVIPITGQFVSAGLAIAGLFTKLFAGKRKEKKERGAREAKARRDEASQRIRSTSPVNATQGPMGSGGREPVGATAPVAPPPAPRFSTWGGGQAPSVQPTQQVINNKLGF